MVAVMVVAQTIQVVLFTAGLFAFFLALGIIAIPYEVTVLWSGEQTCQVGQPPCAPRPDGTHPVPADAKGRRTGGFCGPSRPFGYR
ncbi:hypothetical protein GCM10010409_45820 [Mycolicibacterium diernhoferi]|nr:hypothetical protein [Mycolicibacterium diernhoferi]OJZ67678.1 hypothetical protein BRW64_05300 [Mycolicibacterium diernhoferi]